MSKVNIKQKFTSFQEAWTPKIIGECNDQLIKIFKARGEFIWHCHEHEDELFMVMSGELHIALREETIILHPGEMYIVPRGVEHKPFAPKEAHVLLVEPKTVLNTGNIQSKQTVANPEKI